MNTFFNKKNRIDDNQFLSKVASLLIHAAKIDEAYTEDEKEIVRKTLIKLGAESSNIDKLMEDFSFEKRNLINGHVDIWTYNKAN